MKVPKEMKVEVKPRGKGIWLYTRRTAYSSMPQPSLGTGWASPGAALPAKYWVISGTVGWLRDEVTYLLILARNHIKYSPIYRVFVQISNIPEHWNHLFNYKEIANWETSRRLYLTYLHRGQSKTNNPLSLSRKTNGKLNTFIFNTTVPHVKDFLIENYLQTRCGCFWKKTF